MTEKSRQNRSTRQPVGFTPRSTGLAGEYAREQGWGLNEEERTKTSTSKQDFDGGTDYDYGPRDFGDSATDTSATGAQPRQSPPRRSSPQSQSATGRSSANKSSHSRPR